MDTHNPYASAYAFLSLPSFAYLSSIWPLRYFISLYFSLLASYFFFIFLIMYVVFIAPPDSSISIFLLQTLPSFLGSITDSICGASFTARLSKCSHWVTSERNPLMQIVYLLVVGTAWSVMIFVGYDFIRAGNPFLGMYHCTLGYVVYATCLTTFYLACTVPAGTIDAGNLEAQETFPYDNVLFSSKICTRTNVRKLARSKFCKMSNRHIPRFDHFCVWLNQSVGYHNYRFFLLFLLVHALMLTYGFVACALILYGRATSENLFQIQFYNTKTREYVNASWLVVFSYLSKERGLFVVGLLILSGVMGLVMWGFAIFHFYLTSWGMTTNEYFKWQDLKRWHKHATTLYVDAKAGKNGWTAGPAFDLKSADYAMVGVTKEMIDRDVGCIGVSGAVEPVEVKKEEGEKKSDERIVEDPGPFPVNIYDRGFVNNWLEVLFLVSVGPSVAEGASVPEGMQKKKKKKSKGCKNKRD